MVFRRKHGIQNFIYLDDILVVDHSPWEVEWSLWTALQTLTQRGYIINLKKSYLTPVQELVYIRGRFHTDLAVIFLPDPRKEALFSCVILSFGRMGSYKSVHQFLHLLGLMVATLLVMPTCHLWMRPIQLYLKDWWWSHLGLNYVVFINSDLVWAIQKK